MKVKWIDTWYMPSYAKMGDICTVVSEDDNCYYLEGREKEGWLKNRFEIVDDTPSPHKKHSLLTVPVVLHEMCAITIDPFTSKLPEPP